MNEQKKNNGLITTVVVLLVILVGAYGFWRYTKKDDSQGGTTEQTTQTPVTENTSGASGSTMPTEDPDGNPIDVKNIYADGTYKAEGDYFSPEGAESINVTITLKDGIITDANVESLAFRRESQLHQAQFISGFKSQVIGKKIDDIHLTKVSGSSLTPKGFNDAVEKIKSQALAAA